MTLFIDAYMRHSGESWYHRMGNMRQYAGNNQINQYWEITNYTYFKKHLWFQDQTNSEAFSGVWMLSGVKCIIILQDGGRKPPVNYIVGQQTTIGLKRTQIAIISESSPNKYTNGRSHILAHVDCRGFTHELVSYISLYNGGLCICVLPRKDFITETVIFWLCANDEMMKLIKWWLSD